MNPLNHFIKKDKCSHNAEGYTGKGFLCPKCGKKKFEIREYKQGGMSGECTSCGHVKSY